MVHCHVHPHSRCKSMVALGVSWCLFWGLWAWTHTLARPNLYRILTPAQRLVKYTAEDEGASNQWRRLTPASDAEIHAHAALESPDIHFRRIRRKLNKFLQDDTVAFDPEGIVADNDTTFQIGFYAQNGTNLTSSGGYTLRNIVKNSTEAPDYQPMRIRAFLQKNITLSVDQRNTLVLDIIKPALLAWSAALRVIPVQGNLTVDPEQLDQGERCGPTLSHHVLVPEDHIQFGVPETDLIIYIHLAHVETNSTQHHYDVSYDTNASAYDETQNTTLVDTCTGGYLGASAICSTDQFDRPTAALLHLCLGPSFFSPLYLSDNIMTVMHELGHALGFNSISLAHFRNRDGTPKTPRDELGRVPLVSVECAGPKSSRHNATIPLPSSSILQFREVRNGIRAAEVVTPTVTQVVRNHFGCQDLPGAELESGESLILAVGEEISCLGDHWERRLFESDLMNPVVSGLELSSRFSTMTLAYFADSGWYQVDLSRAAQAVSWGRGLGCGFVNETCIVDGAVHPQMDSFFCTESMAIITNIHGCTNDLSRKASCMIGNHSNPLPPEFQYFNDSHVGGADAFLDYCPVYNGFLNGLCSDAENEALIRVNSIERFGSRNSRCLSGMQQSGRTALCLPIACVLEDRSLRVQVDYVWHVCHYNDQEILTSNGDIVYCPDPVRVCPTFYCNRDCLGTSRICDFSSGKCVCPDNFTETETGCESRITSSTKGPIFFDPIENSEVLPEQDSPLSDYYVSTARALHEQDMKWLSKQSGWKASFMATIVLLILSVLLAIFYRRNHRLNAWLVDRPDGGDSDEGTHRNRDKHKAMATIVVGIRMQDPTLFEYQFSETDTAASTIATNATRGTIADLSMVSEVGIPSGEDDHQAIMRRRRQRSS